MRRTRTQEQAASDLDRAPNRSVLLSVLSRRPFTRLFKPVEQIRKRMLGLRMKRAVRGRSSVRTVYQHERTWIAKRAAGSAEGAIEQNFQLAADLLETAAVPFFVIPDETGRRSSIGVRESHWDAFVRAVEAADPAAPIYLGINARTRTGAIAKTIVSVDSDLGQRALRRQDGVEVFQFYADSPASCTYGRAFACTVSKWRSDEAGGLATAYPNQRTTAIAPEWQTEREVQVHGRSARSFDVLLKTNIFEHTEPIDAVYMWVDGNDPAWQERRRRVLAEQTGAISPDSAHESRFRDNGELRYSLRSIHEHCDWIRNIILVTDDQVPAWLNVDHERIRIVDHRELFGDAGRLPTFNSHAIAARLHHIDGLSERYLIFNDDVFIGHRTDPGQFFHSNGVAKFFLSKSTLPYDLRDAPAHEFARRNSADLIEREFGVTATRNFYHTPLPQLKSVLFELEERFPEVFEPTWSHQLRSPEDYEINGWLHYPYAYLTKRAVPGRISYDYFDLSRADVPDRLARLLQTRNRATFCINDNPDATPAHISYARDWMEDYFSIVAPWEV